MSLDKVKNGSYLALVTGAGHRLGREIAIKIAQLGYNVALHYYTSKQQAGETHDFLSKAGYSSYIFQADLTNPDQIRTLFNQVEKIGIPLDLLVNSAAVMLDGKLTEATVDDWDITMDLNLRAVWLCSQHASLLMQNQGGSIINISDSGAGRLWTRHPAYSISKAGVEILTRLLAKTLAPGIRVNAVAPGLILPPASFPNDEWDRLIDKLPLKKSGSPEYIVDTIEYLLNNDYITGQVITVDGGYQLI